MVAGASIGALNGAVLASAPSLQVAVTQLEKLWLTLAESSPLSLKFPSYLSLLTAAGLRMNGLPYLRAVAQAARLGSQVGRLAVPGLPLLLDLLDQLGQVEAGAGLVCDKRVQALIDEYLDPHRLASGLPFYVSVFNSQGGMADVVNVLKAEIGLFETADSEFVHLQSLPPKDQREVLLASAALPLLFAPRRVGYGLYSDGGQGGWQKMQGNTPITPLLTAGCRTVIVTHLSDGSLWSRQDFPSATVLEVRPQSSIARAEGHFGGAKDLLGFDAEKIPSWIEQGYADTLDCVGRVVKAAAARNCLRQSEVALHNSEIEGQASDLALEHAMSRLR